MPVNDFAIVFENVVKRYPGPHGEITAVDGADLSVETGEIFGLLGPNGAGKTTSIEMLVGLRRPTSGKVRVLGFDPVKQRDKVREHVAIQPQQAAVFDQQTVVELLRTWASFYPSPAGVDEVIARMGLQDARDVRAAKLSGGQRQRLLVATALISRPRVLVLDEPSTGMDPNARQELWDAVRAHRDSGGTVLLSTHSMEEAETLCDRVAIMNKGRVVACGAPGDLVLAHAPERELVFTVPKDSDLTTLESCDGVVQLAAHDLDGGTRVRLRTTDSDSVFGVLTGPLGARQIQVRDAGLEGVFRRLTGSAFAEMDGELETAGATGKNGGNVKKGAVK
ncbi:ABC transporter ATP-binding protein [Sphaerisporangium album]|uniref:ABC transporter ATP-binding protein n=1 Tax=Sphaerisporangium album TaxID=509200 RepID=A0A367FJI8_9ACTN|nr:ABC transporter ATP-binding protein [Sphaerisporangium album]RCG30546.1 ABC transporter ATP-binding protein [Sphaerisporangium album]